MKYKVLSGFVKPAKDDVVGELAEIGETIDLLEKDTFTKSLLRRNKIAKIETKKK